LGSKTGAPVYYSVSPLNLLSPLLPWLLVLALLFARPNRSGRAWWVLAPLLGVQALAAALVTALAFVGSSGLDFFGQGFGSLSFAFAALWLLLPYFSGKGRAAAFFGSLLTILLGTMAFGSAANGMSEGLAFLIAFLFIGFNAALAFSLATVFCRKSCSQLRFLVWMIVWLLALWLVTTSPFIVIALLQVGVAALGAVVIVFVATAASFLTFLPFLILSLAEPFYRARFQAFLGQLPATQAAPAPPVVPAPSA